MDSVYYHADDCNVGLVELSKISTHLFAVLMTETAASNLNSSG